MLTTVTPSRLEAPPGRPVVVAVQITNNLDIISGYRLRVLGVDERWVRVDAESLSLFPADTVTVAVTITLPEGLVSGDHRATIQVTELTAPAEVVLLPVDLEVPATIGIDMRVDPMVVYAGKNGAFALLMANTGNTAVSLPLYGSDEEGKVAFAFDPPGVTLAPGDQSAVQVKTRAKRRFVGQPVVRTLTFGLGEPDTPTGRQATGTMIQRAAVSRGAVSLVGLLASVTVFALVITAVLAHLVSTTAADRDLALQVAQAQQASQVVGGSSGISGTVELLTSQTPVGGVTVDLFTMADTANAITSVATDTKGTYTLANLPPGSYKIRYRGAGFAEIWYPQSLTAADAGTVNLQAGQSSTNVDVLLGGLPATLSGTVLGDDTSGATITLQVPTTTQLAASSTVVSAGGSGATSTSLLTQLGAGGATVPAPQVAPAPDSAPSGSLSLLQSAEQLPTATTATDPGPGEAAGAVIQTQAVGTGGVFALASIPSPATYQLVVSKPGYATTVQTIDLGGGEQRKNVTIRLSKGDGLVSGHIIGPTGPLGDASISATDGTDVTQTVSSSTDDIGSFALRSLPTPSNLVLTVSADGLASQTLAITLSDAQQLGGVDITLAGSAATVSGTVALADGSSPNGVSVSVTNGNLTLQTVTSSDSSGNQGVWQLTGLAVPSSYAITFSRSDLASQTVSVTLGPASTATPTVVQRVVLTGSTASLSGLAYSATATGARAGVGDVNVVLTSGAATYQVTTATGSASSNPGPATGSYEIDRLPPGTYTATFNRPGARAASQVVTLVAGQKGTLDVALQAPATIITITQDQAGTNNCTSGATCSQPGVIVRVFLAAQYPTTPVESQTTTTAGNGNDQASSTFTDLDAPQTYIVDFTYPSGSQPQASSTLTLAPSTTCTITYTAGADPSVSTPSCMASTQ